MGLAEEGDRVRRGRRQTMSPLGRPQLPPPPPGRVLELPLRLPALLPPPIVTDLKNKVTICYAMFFFLCTYIRVFNRML